MSEYNEVTFEHLLKGLEAGMPGTVIEARMKSYEDGAADGGYTVYWPKDSIRVIRGADYATARAVACVLRHERARWMGDETTFAEPIVARIRRPLDSEERATTDQVRSQRIYVKDKLLHGDIRAIPVDFEMHQAEFPGAPYRFDFSTLPEGS